MTPELIITGGVAALLVGLGLGFMMFLGNSSMSLDFGRPAEKDSDDEIPDGSVRVGKPVTLAVCPPGIFLCDDVLCFKTEYHTDDGFSECYCLETGEYFSKGTESVQEYQGQKVVPIEISI